MGRLLLPNWAFFFSLFLSLNQARLAPFLSPTYGGPLPPPQADSPYASSISAAPFGMQVAGGEQHHRLDKELFLAIIVVSTLVGSIFLSSLCIWICWWNISQKSHLKGVRNSDVNRGLTLGPISDKFSSLKTTPAIEYSSLESATGNFSESNVLGEGGFGHVFKACFDDGLVAAVKRITNGGQDSEREFENEIELSSRIQHLNIVSLLGYCIHGQTRLLVYELMQNGSLESQLHGPSHGSALSWHLRMKIALDAARPDGTSHHIDLFGGPKPSDDNGENAQQQPNSKDGIHPVGRGLEFLHEHCNPPVIHRDLKSSNILLDSNFNAKISDFGLALTVGSQNKSSIKLSGTLGYVAPEYLLDGKLTEKSDVYAFGVVLLELLMGRKPVEKMAPAQCQSIVTWAMPQLTDRSKLPNIIDPVIQNTMDLKHLYQVAAVAVLCVQPEPSYRPLITDVLHSLVPLVPVKLGGTLRVANPASNECPKSSNR